MQVGEILNQVYFGNTVEDYCWFLGAFLVVWIFKRWLSHLLSDLLFFFLKKGSKDVSRAEFETLLKKPLNWIIMLSVLFLGTSHIEFPESWEMASIEEFGVRRILDRIYKLLFFSSIIWLGLRIIDYFGLRMARKADETESKFDDQVIPFLKEAIKVIVIILGAFFILDNVFEVDVTTIVAGLGIGGVALALASKESLENLLGSFTIFLDKPFTIGDVVTVNGITGTVEKVGFRSTRLRTFEKSYVTIPNKKMVDVELDNLTLRTFRRARFAIGVTYDTSLEQMHAIVADIQKLLDENQDTNMEGVARFHEFGPSSLDILVMYYVDTDDYNHYLDVKQYLNYEIIKIVEKHGAEFAFPSTSVYFHDETKRNTNEK